MEFVVNYFITGSVGTGKTHTAKTMLAKSAKSYQEENPFEGYVGDKFVMLNCTELAYKSTIQKLKLEVLDMIHKPIALVLDDLGVTSSKFGYDIIYMAVDYRLDKGKRTIVTSNLSLAEIGEQIDKRLASRLEMYELIQTSGEDRRTKLKGNSDE